MILRDADERDIEFMKYSLREAEVLEIWASDHMSPEEMLTASMKRSSESFTLVHKEKIVGMLGLVPDSLISERATVWLLTTNEIYSMWIRFLKISKPIIEGLQAKYPVLYNFVDSRNEQCLRWLRWCGAKVYPPESHGADGMPFNYFTFGGQ